MVSSSRRESPGSRCELREKLRKYKLRRARTNNQECGCQVVATALSAYNPNMPVRVEASGSQSHDDWNKPEAEKTGTKANYLSVNIEPIWNFAE